MIPSLHNIVTPNKISCIEICTSLTDTSFNLNIIKKGKSNFESQFSKDNISTLEEVALSCKPYTSIVHLNISSAKTIYRRNPSNQSNIETLQTIIPGININDYIIQEHKEKEGSWIAILRKEYLQEWMNRFQENGLYIYSINLGPFAIHKMFGHFNFAHPIQTSAYQIYINEDNLIQEINKGHFSPHQSRDISTEQSYSNNELLLFASGVSTLSESNYGISSPAIINLKKETLSKIKFDLLLKPVIIGISFLLSIFFAWTFFLTQKINHLDATSSQKREQVSHIDSLNTRIDNQQQLINETHISGNSRTSFYADRIGNTIPKEIKLTELNIYPLIQKKEGYSQKELQQFDTKKIQISGKSNSVEIYYNWLSNLSMLNWTKNVDNISYQELKKGMGNFKCIIELP